MTIGCFEVIELSPGRWKVRNTLTNIHHVTYGTLAELRPILQKQTRAWKAKLGPQKIGSAWRNSMMTLATKTSSRASGVASSAPRGSDAPAFVTPTTVAKSSTARATTARARADRTGTGSVQSAAT